MIIFTGRNGGEISFSNGQITSFTQDSIVASEFLDSMKGQEFKIDGIPLQLSENITDEKLEKQVISKFKEVSRGE